MKLPRARNILPFVRMFYGEVSSYLLDAEDGSTHDIRQAEGGEQGDPLMPILFSLGMDRALKMGTAHLESGELAFAYLDDVYLLVRRNRARAF